MDKELDEKVHKREAFFIWEEFIMKNQFIKVYKCILPVVIIGISIIICTACGKEEQKIMASVLAGEYLNESWNNGMQILNVRLAGEWEILKDQTNNLTEDDGEVVNANEESTEDNTAVSKTNEEGKEDEWDVDFDIVRTEYIYDEQRNGIEIYYPQLCGLVNSTKEETINALIEEDVKKIIGDKNKEGDASVYCVVLDYKIKFLNEQIISILYKGMYGYIMPGHGLNAKVKTTTIDIEEEKIIDLKDVVTDFAELSDMLMADEFEHVTMWEGSTGGYKISWIFESGEELEENLREIYQQWYTDGNNFVVITENTRADYNEYSISNESVKHILDEEFLGKLEKSYSHPSEEEHVEELRKIMQCLDEQVPEINNEWTDYVADKSEGEAYITASVIGEDMSALHIETFDVYRDYEKTEYLGKYYYIFVGEQWDDHCPPWAYFYVSEDFDEVLWNDIAAGKDSEYPVLYLDEWRNSDFYPKLDK